MKLVPTRRPWAAITALSVCSLTVLPQRAAAQEHVVPLAELRKDLASSTQKRVKDAEDIRRVLALPAAQEALQKAGVNQAQVRTAVALLSDAELARLADRARVSEQDVQGGFIVGILALIGLIVVIIVVLAVVA